MSPQLEKGSHMIFIEHRREVELMWEGELSGHNAVVFAPATLYVDYCVLLQIPSIKQVSARLP